jgi:hypothetical protein
MAGWEPASTEDPAPGSVGHWIGGTVDHICPTPKESNPMAEEATNIHAIKTASDGTVQIAVEKYNELLETIANQKGSIGSSAISSHGLA